MHDNKRVLTNKTVSNKFSVRNLPVLRTDTSVLFLENLSLGKGFVMKNSSQSKLKM